MNLFRWALLLVVIALIATPFAYGGVGGAFTSIALIVFWIAISLSIILLLMGLLASESRPLP